MTKLSNLALDLTRALEKSVKQKKTKNESLLLITRAELPLTDN